MQNDGNTIPVKDRRIALFHGIIGAICLLLVGVMVKSCGIDTTVVHGNQMNPTLLKGDRILFFRTPYLPVFRSFRKSRIGIPVIFRDPSMPTKRNSLRIAGLPGDTVLVDSGTISLLNKSSIFPDIDNDTTEILPPDFSPRDFFKPYRIPAPGDTFDFSKLRLRDFFFAASVVGQENPEKIVDIKPELVLDDTVANDYIITDFSLYKGPFDSIPERFHTDWFFWERLREYIRLVNKEREVTIQFSLLQNESPLDSYVVRNSFIFLIADNWDHGFDSRYFGPVRTSLIEGKIFGVLWSFRAGENGKKRIRSGRIGKMIR
jgi:signal peptidase I